MYTPREIYRAERVKRKEGKKEREVEVYRSVPGTFKPHHLFNVHVSEPAKER